MRRSILAAGLGLALGWWTTASPAQDTSWRPAPPSAMVLPQAVPAVAPAVSLGRPVPLADLPPTPAERVSYRSAEGSASGTVVRAQASEVPAPGFAPPPPVPVNPNFPVTPQERYNSGVLVEPPPAKSKGWFDWMPTWNGGGFAGSGARSAFQSDHCFDQFISPVTNPFLFEDPRALTELRPIFIWQQTPSDNYVYGGGDILFAGLQGRVAFTDCFSVVLHKLGWIWNEPHNSAADPGREFSPHTGLAELMIGPKYTFWRNDSCGRLGAVGLIFDIPIGPRKVFQDTGDLSLIPYVSFGFNFLRSSYGSFNLLNTTGYSFAVDNRRTDYFYNSFHLDYDVANLHKIYPFMELNWFNYTKAGKARQLGFEGADLFNFGSRGVSGHDNLTLAFGARYKFCEAIQIGTAAEFPIVGRRDLMDFRLTVDMIFRY